MTSTIKVNKIQDSCGSALVTKCGSNITLGASGKNIIIACGASTVGMGRSGTVDWCSTIYTNSPGTITSISGKGYFINTTSGAVTINLPSSPSVGDIISVKDYARTFNTNNLTIGRGGSKMCGACSDTSLTSAGASATLIYADSTKGWMFINEDTTQQAGASFITATGGTITTSGNYKIHTFTSDANFVVSDAGNAGGSNKVSYMVVAGGGGGGKDRAGGGGGGGFREGRAPAFDSYTASPLVAPDGLTVSATTYPITVGAGGSGVSVPTPAPTGGTSGANSIFSTITSAGGGRGGSGPGPVSVGADGGSGGGSDAYGNPSSAPNMAAGSGNTPPVSPPQGNNGGVGIYNSPNGTGRGGGGGGATAVGTSSTPGGNPGGAGATSEITASPVAYSGGGGGSSCGSGGVTGGTGGGGKGGCSSSAAVAGTANTGGGGGGSNGGTGSGGGQSGAGGSGVVIIRYKYQ
jgi:hypothetical protein